jgi:hypothetical protein
MKKIEYIMPTRKEKSEWKKHLYTTLTFLAMERPDFYPRKRDSLATLLESYLYWADEFNEGYFPEKEEAENNRFCAWLVQEQLINNDYALFKETYNHPF